METIPADRPITEDLTPNQIADLIDAAAQLIETDGLEVGDLWSAATDRWDYEPGDSCCTAGALAVVCGYRRADQVEEAFTATSCVDACDEDGQELPWEPHPVFAAVLDKLGFDTPEDLYNWSDSAGDSRVVAALREAATKIRAQAGGAA
jgi:hypothetical protein